MSATVLVVDDSATIRQQVGSALSEAGLNVVEAIDGDEGLAKIRAGGINCVVCDVNMPKKNGIEMVEEVKKDAALANLPIIMLTTEGAKDLIVRAKAAGASGWIVKPFKPEMLIAAVNRLSGLA